MTKFVTVNLTMNVATHGRIHPGGPVMCSCSEGGSCNDGGSYICTATTEGCAIGLSCAGTSYTHQDCDGGSIFALPDTHIQVSLPETEIAALHSELQRVIIQFAGRDC